MKIFVSLEDLDGNVVTEVLRLWVDDADGKKGSLYLDYLDEEMGFVDRDTALRLLNDHGGPQSRYRLVTKDGRRVNIFLLGGTGNGSAVAFSAAESLIEPPED